MTILDRDLDDDLVERIGRELYGQYRLDMLLFATAEAGQYLPPWSRTPANIRDRFEDFAIAVHNSLRRIEAGLPSPTEAPQMAELDAKHGGA